jgi:hypothetical protein
VTPTSSVTPTPTKSPGNVQYSAYVFAEPQDSTSMNDLGQYMFDASNGDATYYGYSNTGGYPAGPAYAYDMNLYVQFSAWTGSNGSFVSNVANLSNTIRQASGSGTDAYGCTQNQYTFGSIDITTSDVNPNIQYVYSVWIPLAGVGGTFNNMTLDAGFGAACSTSIIDNSVPDSINSAINVTVPTGCAIPAGTYRILWIQELILQPATTPLTNTLWIKGDTKT